MTHMSIEQQNTVETVMDIAARATLLAIVAAGLIVCMVAI